MLLWWKLKGRKKTVTMTTREYSKCSKCSVVCTLVPGTCSEALELLLPHVLVPMYW